MVERVIAACDGAAKGNPGPAGWAFVVADATGAPQFWRSGPLGHSTNNIGELTALEQLLAATDPAVPLEVRLDSTYTRDAVTKWLAGWKRNGWKTAGGKPVANRELIQRIDALLADREVTFVYVPAHQVDGDPLNAVADKAASDAARLQQAAGGTAADLPVPDPVKAKAQRSTRPPSSRSTAGSGTGSTAGAGAGSAAKPAGKGAPRTLAARFPGTCPCGRPYAKGDPITRVSTSWGHPDCAVAHT
ncbi:ribonuclease HI [Streptacidiphilus sp. PB12-B1b]|uniref:ribonuclease H family protein n=1 Tax=Streptacidiphilus sp. PB12-B1b TaxID=2705012 RepID=UPI0015F8C5DF|nr:ribonuclease H [Streptacidiphilus sp. PB12-B1b]QMU77281.1 ribonuclease HI [Streptacidiphilus sp. PB12-B1b]